MNNVTVRNMEKILVFSEGIKEVDHCFKKPQRFLRNKTYLRYFVQFRKGISRILRVLCKVIHPYRKTIASFPLRKIFRSNLSSFLISAVPSEIIPLAICSIFVLKVTSLHEHFVKAHSSKFGSHPGFFARTTQFQTV